MTAVKLVNNKGKSLLVIAEQVISSQAIEDALRAAQFAYDQRLQALRADATARERDLQARYLEEVAAIVATD